MSDAATALAPVATAAPDGFAVLEVDDAPNILWALHRMQRAHADSVLAAPQLQQAPVDLINSDRRMPEMNGAEFLRRSRQGMPEAVRILLTASAGIGSTTDAVNRGETCCYVSKPWSDEAPPATLRDGLERKQLESKRDRLLAPVPPQPAQLETHAELPEQLVRQRTQALSQAHGALQTPHNRGHDGFMDTLRMLSHLPDQRAGLAGGCGRAAAILVGAVGPKPGLAATEVQDSFHAAPLQDLGRLGPADRQLDNPLHAPLMAEQHLLAMPAPAGAGRLLRVASDYYRLLAGCIERRCFAAAEARRWLGRGGGTHHDPAMVVVVARWLTESQAAPAPRARLPVRRLQLGMVLAPELTAGTLLLVPQGRALDATLIAALAPFDRRQANRFTLEI